MAAHHSLGTLPIYYFGTEEQKQQWLPRPRLGREAGRVRADRAGTRARTPGATPDARRAARRRVGHRTARRSSSPTRAPTSPPCVTITARHRREARSRTSSSRTARPATRSPRRCRSSAGAPPTRASCRSRTARVPEENLLGPRGEGFQQFLRSSTAAASRSRRWASASRRAPTTSPTPTRSERQQFGKPIAKFQAVQFQARRHGDGDRGRPRARLQGGVGEGPGPPVRADGGDGEALHGRALAPGGERGAADPRRLRLHGRVRRSRASTATRRSSRSAKARTRCSAWSSPGISACRRLDDLAHGAVYLRRD